MSKSHKETHQDQPVVMKPLGAVLLENLVVVAATPGQEALLDDIHRDFAGRPRSHFHSLAGNASDFVTPAGQKTGGVVGQTTGGGKLELHTPYRQVVIQKQGCEPLVLDVFIREGKKQPFQPDEIHQKLAAAGAESGEAKTKTIFITPEAYANALPRKKAMATDRAYGKRTPTEAMQSLLNDYQVVVGTDDLKKRRFERCHMVAYRLGQGAIECSSAQSPGVTPKGPTFNPQTRANLEAASRSVNMTMAYAAELVNMALLNNKLCKGVFMHVESAHYDSDSQVLAKLKIASDIVMSDGKIIKIASHEFRVDDPRMITSEIGKVIFLGVMAAAKMNEIASSPAPVEANELLHDQADEKQESVEKTSVSIHGRSEVCVCLNEEMAIAEGVGSSNVENATPAAGSTNFENATPAAGSSSFGNVTVAENPQAMFSSLSQDSSGRLKRHRTENQLTGEQVAEMGWTKVT